VSIFEFLISCSKLVLIFDFFPIEIPSLSAQNLIMKNLLLYTALFLFISLNSAQYSSRGVIQPIDQEDYDLIFHEAFTAKDKTVIRGSDLNRTLNSVIRAAFTKNKVLFTMFLFLIYKVFY